MNYYDTKNPKEHWSCGECGEVEKPYVNLKDCICRTLWISIPPGQHIHMDCPAHGRIKVNGPMPRYA